MSLIFCLGLGPEPFPIPAAREPFFISKILSVTVYIYIYIYYPKNWWTKPVIVTFLFFSPIGFPIVFLCVSYVFLIFEVFANVQFSRNFSENSEFIFGNLHLFLIV